MAVTSYTFRTLNPDGSTYGRGCFSYEGPPDNVDIQFNFGTSAGGTANKMLSFWYHDPVAGTRDLSNLINFNFTHRWQGVHERFDFNLWNFPYNSHGLTAGQAQPGKPGPISGHRGDGDVANQKKLEFPTLAPATMPSNKPVEDGGAGKGSGTVVIPQVDLVVVMDSSASMRDEADALSKAVSAAINAAKSSCPSDLQVTYLGIEGTFKSTKFETTVRDHLTKVAKVDEARLKGRKKGSVAGGGGQEDGARVIEDVSTHFNWRAGALRNIFFLGDESLEGGNVDGKQDQADIDAANLAIAAAKKVGTKVHTYLGTSAVKKDVRDAITGEYARVASATGGQAFTSRDAISGFQALLEKVICGSKSPPPVLPPTKDEPFCCCQQYVTGK